MYWVRPEQILSCEPGMHRFVWDLHLNPPKALEQEFPISAIVHNTPLVPLGARPLPGKYTVELTVDGKKYRSTIQLKMDPRITASTGDLTKQFEMESASVAGMNDSYDALLRMHSLRAQLKDLTPKLHGKAAADASALDKQFAALEGSAQPNFFGTPPSGKQPENFSSINQHFSAMLAVADSADAAPTAQANAAFQELQGESAKLQKRWNALKEKELLDLNKNLKKTGLAELDPDKPPAKKPGGVAEGDDEP
jgi:hypothetical protein